MSAGTPILMLLLYPLLFSLPLNPVRLRWGLMQGLTPMPPDLEEGAEAVDRAVLFGIQLTLLAVVIFVMRASSIPMYDIGFIASNWKSAIAFGALLSFIPVGLGGVFSRNLSPEGARKNPESRGPVATWCGLIALGSISIESWRVFCIAALLRLDLRAWIAVLIASIAYGAAQLHTNTARAVGAALFGGAAGLLFVKTGSLLAPLTMSLLTMGAHLYRARHVSSQTNRILPPVECPICSQAIDRTQIPHQKCFPCPGCGQKLRPYLDWSWQGPVCGIVGALATLFVLDLDIFWSLVLFVPFFFLFAVLSMFFVAAIPRFRTIEIYYDSGDPSGRLFRF